MMVGKGMLQDVQPNLAQILEKPPRIANASDRMNGAVTKPGQRGTNVRIGQTYRRVAAQAHQILIAPSCAIANHEIHLTQAGQRLPQWPSGQTGPITHPAESVYHRNLKVTTQAIMLQPIIAKDDVAIVSSEQRPRCCDPIRSYHHRTTAALRQQHRLVADLARVAVSDHYCSDRPP